MIFNAFFLPSCHVWRKFLPHYMRMYILYAKCLLLSKLCHWTHRRTCWWLNIHKPCVSLWCTHSISWDHESVQCTHRHKLHERIHTEINIWKGSKHEGKGLEYFNRWNDTFACVFLYLDCFSHHHLFISELVLFLQVARPMYLYLLLRISIHMKWLYTIFCSWYAKLSIYISGMLKTIIW